MRRSATLRTQMITLFLFAIILPIIAMSLIVSTFSKVLLSNETARLTDTIISTLAKNIEIYQEELNRLTIIPYLNEDIFYAIKLKSGGGYETAGDYNRLLADRALNTTLPKYFHNTRDDILGVTIVMGNGTVFQTTREAENYTYLDPSVLESRWYREAVKAQGKAVFLGSRNSSHYFYPPGTQVFSVARIIVDPDSRIVMGAIIADADAQVLDSLMSPIDFTVSSKIIITDRYDQQVYTALTGDVDGAFGDRATYRTVAREIDSSGWKISVLLSDRELSRRVAWIYAVGMSLILLALIMSLYIYRRLSKIMVQPVQNMVSVMRAAEKGDFSPRVSSGLGQNNEISVLGETLNHMIVSLSEHINREYVLTIEQKTAEYRALQSQIKPHFLYNTLNGFLTLNRMGEREKLEKAIRDLTGMLRYLQEKDILTTLKEEFDFIDRYCRLQKLRFPGRLSYTICLDDQAGNLVIPRLLIQPLVENAVIHGIEPVTKSSEITLNAMTEEGNGWTVIELSDDGAGFDSSSIDISGTNGMGNSFGRLKVLYPSSSFTLKSEVGRGTHIRIRIPGDGQAFDD